jgi:hypothetical protein
VILCCIPREWSPQRTVRGLGSEMMMMLSGFRVTVVPQRTSAYTPTFFAIQRTLRAKRRTTAYTQPKNAKNVRIYPAVLEKSDIFSKRAA